MSALRHRGFTLIEMMIASSISVIVLTSVFSAFFAVQRMLSTSMAESELMLASREIRDKLLFQISPSINGYTYAGLLSGTNTASVLDGTVAVRMSGCGIGDSLTDVAAQPIRLLLWSDESGGRYFINERMPDKDKYASWLAPSGITMLDSSMSEVLDWEDRDYSIAASDVYRLYIDINLAAGGGVFRKPVVRRERIMIPLAGKLQPLKDKSDKY